MLVFLTHDGELYAHFISHKTQLVVKKHIKSEILFDFVYGKEQIDMFIAENSGVKLYKIDDEKKNFRDNISCMCST